MDLQLVEKTALVTGSNKGTGEVIAKTLASEGATVIFHSNEEGGCEEIAASIDNGIAVWGDLTQADGAECVLDQLKYLNLTVDILVNNYGTAERGKWKSSTQEDWIRMYQCNVLSAMTLAQGLIEPMKDKGWGRIIQLGTIGTDKPNAIMPHYYAAKGALVTMGVSLAKELANTGVTVNTVSPGYIKTPELEAGFRLKAKKNNWGDDWKDIEAQIVKTEFPNPCGRIAERQEVADLVAFLCSERAGFINGQNIRIDGGATA